MSNIKRLFKPKIARLITGLAIVVVIVGGSIYAFRGKIFADTTAPTCSYTVSDLTPGANFDTVYIAKQQYTNLIVSNPKSTNFQYLTRIDSAGGSYSSLESDLTVVIHKLGADSSVTPRYERAYCTQSGVFEIAANLNTGSLDVKFYQVSSDSQGNTNSSSASTTGSTTKCAHLDNEQYAWLTQNSSTQHWVSSDGRYDYQNGDIYQNVDSGAANYFVADSYCSTSNTSTGTTGTGSSVGNSSTGTTGTTKQGCPNGKKCVSVYGVGYQCVDNSTSIGGDISSAESTQCSYQSTSPNAVTNVSKDVSVPTTNTGSQAASQYQNKINFTAYRESYAEVSKVVAMGGVKFAITGYSSAISNNIASVADLQPSSNNSVITQTSAGKCSLVDSLRNQLYGRFVSSYSKSFITPDQGPIAFYSQTINVPPGYYYVTYSKNGFGSGSSQNEQRICFQVGTNDGVATPIKINALLYAQPGAEPPGITASGSSGGVQVSTSSRDQLEYRTNINNVLYKYMPDCAWYGWQKDDANFQCGSPVGTASSGLSVPGIPPYWGITTGNIQQYLNQCQNWGVQVGNIDSGILPWIGALFGAWSGIQNNESLGGVLSRTTLGGLSGWALSQASGSSGTSVSINVGQANAQCQALYSQAIPAQCQSCFTGGTYNQSTCTPDCISRMPYYQSLLQGSGNFNI